MRTHTQEFKSKIKEFGREFDDTLYYSANGVTTTYDGDHLSNVNYSYDTSLLKSVMQTLTFDSDLDLEVGNLVSYGCSLVGVQDSEIRYNNFIITKKEEQKDTNNYKYTCYDNMIKSMTDYVDLNVTYPITIRSYLSAICTQLGITFGSSSDTFANYDKEVTSEHYLDSDGHSLGYTFRDVLDDIAEAVGGFICIDNNGQLEVRYPSEALDGTPKLPSGYTELSYIESDGTQYIDTGMKLNQNSKVELKIKDVPLVSSMIMGSRSSATSNNFSILTGLVSGNASLVCDFQDYRNNRLSVNVNDIASNEFIIKVNNSKLEINDTSQNVSTYTNFTTPGNAYIFNGSGSYPTGYVKASTKLYYCKIWNGNTLVRNFIPCKNSSNVIGLYDLANNTFYQNAGTGTFIAGDVISYTDTIDEEYFQDNNVNIGKKYGPVNVVVLSRNDADNLYYPSTLPQNPVEIKINNNPILEQTNREDFIQGIYNQLNGLEFYLNDFQTLGVMYYEVGDIYDVSIGENTYQCLMLNDNIIRESGLTENIYTEEPTTSVTDYKYASDTDKLEKTSRNAYFLADKANGVAEMIVEGIGSNGQVTGASVIASINDDESNLTLNADKINLNGAVTANNNFVINQNGSVEINSGYLDLTDEGSITTLPRIKITSTNYDEIMELTSGSIEFNPDDANTHSWFNRGGWSITYEDPEISGTWHRLTGDAMQGIYQSSVTQGNTGSWLILSDGNWISSDGQGNISKTYLKIANSDSNNNVDNIIDLYDYNNTKTFWLDVDNTHIGSSNTDITGNTHLYGNAEIDGDATISGTLTTTTREDYASGGYTYDQYGNMTSKSTVTSNNWNFRGGNGSSDYVIRVYPNSTPKRVVLYTKSFNLTDGAITSDFTNSFQTSLFGETNYNYRIKPFRNGNTAYTPTAGTYAPSLAVTTGDTHFMMSCNYGTTPLCKISAGNAPSGSDKLNWTQEVKWAGEDLYTTAFNIGSSATITNLSSYKYMEIFYARGSDYGQASQKVRIDSNKLTNISLFYRSGNTMRRHTAIVTWDTSANTVTFSSMIEETLTTSGGVTATSITTSSNSYDKIIRIVGYKN